MKYAVYVRVSTDRDEQVSSVENQIDVCRYWLNQQGYDWDENSIYFDDGITGTVLLERHAMQLILEKAKKRELQMVLFKSIHRLARDLKDALEIKEILIANGIRLVTIEEGYDSHYEGKNDMKFEMFAMFASQYPKTLSVSISAALSAKVRRGEHTGGRLPYGYRDQDKKYVINEPEAEVVREMYDMYSKGIGYIGIAKYLNERGIPSKTGGKWQMSSVQRIIRNPIYKGDYILNQYTTVKIGGRKKQIRNPEEKWTIFNKHHPAIVSDEKWLLVNQPNKEKKRRTALWNEFRGIVFCAHCGSAMRVVYSAKKKKDGTKEEWRYLKCSRYKRYGKGECVSHKPIQYKHFREFVLEELEREQNELKTEFESQGQNIHKGKIDNIKKNLKRLEERKKKLVDLYMDNLITKNEFSVRRADMERSIKEQELQLMSTEDIKLANEIHKEFQEAFALLKKEEDLYEVFKRILQRIDISQNGDIKMTYVLDV
ncbi:recombinase family protein [Bacillus wiedmannii]|uniref:recombinase family protein n=1 Tax=Bacillus wiedmannii TaxID=1890302 RepID=UPI000BEF3084|nr:recombinase family protein [Bacillus wiedmannii]PEO37272.1 recombinase family protein [Bacillus wiedmannii]